MNRSLDSADGRSTAPADTSQASRDREEVERLAWILDEAIPLPGGFRIGLDGLMGLLPGVGDVLGMCASGYIVLVARRLGVPLPVVLRMAGNVALETVIGSIPLVGDLFDFVWKANTRNIELLRQHHRPR